MSGKESPKVVNTLVLVVLCGNQIAYVGLLFN